MAAAKSHSYEAKDAAKAEETVPKTVITPVAVSDGYAFPTAGGIAAISGCSISQTTALREKSSITAAETTGVPKATSLETGLLRFGFLRRATATALSTTAS